MRHTQPAEMAKKLEQALSGIKQALVHAKDNPDAKTLYMGPGTRDTAAREIKQLLSTHEAIMDCVKGIESGGDQYSYFKEIKKLIEIFQYQLRQIIFVAAFNSEEKTQRFLSNIFNADQKKLLEKLPEICTNQMKIIDPTRAELDKLIDAIMAVETNNEAIQDSLKEIINKLSSKSEMNTLKKEFNVALVMLEGYAVIKKDTLTLDTGRLASRLIELLQTPAVQKGTEAIFDSLNNIINNQEYWASHGNPKGISKMQEIFKMQHISKALQIRKVIDEAVGIRRTDTIGKLFSSKGREPTTEEFYKALADMDWEGIKKMNDNVSKTERQVPFVLAPGKGEDK